jgi:hypothetical protein
LAGIINLMEIASGNIYQGTYSSNQFNGTVKKGAHPGDGDGWQ